MAEAAARPPGSIGPEARERLLDAARDAIARHLRGLPPPDPPRSPPVLLEPRGAFVTLHRRGELRGCIGYPLPHLPLGEAVVTCARDAATRDSRFPSLRPEEEADLDLEVSVLSVPAPGRPDDIEVGRHGLIVSGRGRRGLLLPQVAVEHGLDRPAFLAATCHKAGLGDRFDPDTMQLELFTAEVFGDAS